MKTIENEEIKNMEIKINSEIKRWASCDAKLDADRMKNSFVCANSFVKAGSVTAKVEKIGTGLYAGYIIWRV